MHQGAVLQNGHHPCNGHAVVGSQGGAFGPQDIAFHHQLDGVFQKVMFHIPVLFAHHVGVALKHQGRQVFAALGAGFCDAHIEVLVPPGIQPLFLGKVQQILADGFLISRPAGDAADLFKIPERHFGLPAFQQIFHGTSSSILCENQRDRPFFPLYKKKPFLSTLSPLDKREKFS